MSSAPNIDPNKQTNQATKSRRVPPSTVFTRASSAMTRGKKPVAQATQPQENQPQPKQPQQPQMKPSQPNQPQANQPQAEPTQAKQPQTKQPQANQPQTKPTQAAAPQRPVRGGQGAAGVTGAGQVRAKTTIPRPEAWEDDISRNTLDETPFTSLASPASRPIKAFQETARMRVIKPLLEGRPIADFVSKDTWPIPTAEDREGYSAGFDEAYWLSGLEDYLKIMKVADQHNITPQSMLDFGCATGRVVRHFAAHSDIPEIWGTDINQRHVRWLYEHLPMSVKPVFNHCIPTLPIPDSSVDIITAFSVFTHIDTFETHWLAELSRIMSDDGMCYLTVHNEATWKVLNQERDNEQNRLIQSIVKIDPDFKNQLAQPMPEGRKIYRFTQSGPYRAQVFHSNDYLRNVWGRFFDIEAILPCHHVRQTVVVLRKKSK
jgi:ubiquinone/menaquinone biosynthesis C-methylase UbiE